MNVADDLQLFHGDATTAAARIYARWNGEEGQSGFTIEGRIVGPQCSLSQTLTAEVSLAMMPDAPSVLAAAILPDPCFWTMRLPAWYQVDLDVYQQGRPVASLQRQLGIRALGADRSSFRWQGKRWVMRGVHIRDSDHVDADACREQATTLVVESPSDALCRTASSRGVLIVAHVAGGRGEIEEVRRLGQWPAVGMVIADHGCPPSAAALQSVPNLVWGESFRSDETIVPSPWAQFIVCAVDDPEQFVVQVASCSLPIVAVRDGAPQELLSRRRSSCDQLQRDLAAHGDYAGYVV